MVQYNSFHHYLLPVTFSNSFIYLCNNTVQFLPPPPPSPRNNLEFLPLYPASLYNSFRVTFSNSFLYPATISNSFYHASLYQYLRDSFQPWHYSSPMEHNLRGIIVIFIFLKSSPPIPHLQYLKFLPHFYFLFKNPWESLRSKNWISPLRCRCIIRSFFHFLNFTFGSEVDLQNFFIILQNKLIPLSSLP